MPSLTDSLSYLRQLPFPQHPKSEELADWVMDLLEMDGYIAGIAASVVAGDSPPTTPVIDLTSLRSQIPHLSAMPTEDNAIHAACTDYMEALEAVAKALASCGAIKLS